MLRHLTVPDIAAIDARAKNRTGLQVALGVKCTGRARLALGFIWAGRDIVEVLAEGISGGISRGHILVPLFLLLRLIVLQSRQHSMVVVLPLSCQGRPVTYTV